MIAGLALLLPLAGCEISESVVAAENEDVVVVEAVLRAGAPRQLVLLHRSLKGDERRPVDSALVSIAGPAGETVRLVQISADSRCVSQTGPSIDVPLASCYGTPDDALDVVPGAEYTLRIETADGRLLRGRTMVPGDFRLLVPAGSSRGLCTLLPRSVLPITWSRSEGAWAYLAQALIRGLDGDELGVPAENVPEQLELTGLAISASDTTLVLPTEFGLFERFDQPELLTALQNGLPEGSSATITVAAVDRNYVNAVRGGAFNPSGAVRISSIAGDGVGVFGSVVPLDFTVRVDAPPLRFPPCYGG